MKVLVVVLADSSEEVLMGGQTEVSVPGLVKAPGLVSVEEILEAARAAWEAWDKVEGLVIAQAGATASWVARAQLQVPVELLDLALAPSVGVGVQV